MKTMVSAILWTVGVLHFVLLFVVLSVGLLGFPPKKIVPIMRKLMRRQLRIMGIRLKVLGLENFDPHRPYIIMGNHESMFDLFAIPAALPMHCVGIEAAYHFSLPFWGYLIRKWGNIPAYRNNPSKAIRSLKKAARVIRSGTSIVVLPEGGRTLTGQIGEFKKGPFLVALSAKADILPFALIGMYAVNNKHSRLLNPGPVCVVFGRPIPYESFKGSSVEELSRTVRKAMIRLKENTDCPGRELRK